MNTNKLRHWARVLGIVAISACALGSIGVMAHLYLENQRLENGALALQKLLDATRKERDAGVAARARLEGDTDKQKKGSAQEIKLLNDNLMAFAKQAALCSAASDELQH